MSGYIKSNRFIYVPPILNETTYKHLVITAPEANATPIYIEWKKFN